MMISLPYLCRNWRGTANSFPLHREDGRIPCGGAVHYLNRGHSNGFINTAAMDITDKERDAYYTEDDLSSYSTAEESHFDEDEEMQVGHEGMGGGRESQRSCYEECIPEGPFSFKILQSIFDRLKDNISSDECEDLLDVLGVSQNREDFQWSLHQLGGFNALLFLYARVVEISDDDEVQSKGLSLVLSQLKNHSKLTDIRKDDQYDLIRFVLNSKKSAFGFKTFIVLINHCLYPSGHKILDYELMEKCLLLSFRSLLKKRVSESDGATGRRSLFECFLSVILDLLVEVNEHRDWNVDLLKDHHFEESLLAICTHAATEPRLTSHLDESDAVRLSALVKDIVSELMAPPDAQVAASIVKYALCPLIPKELPRVPAKTEAYFLYQDGREKSEEGEEVTETSENSQKEEEEIEVGDDRINEADIPELVGIYTSVTRNKNHNNNNSGCGDGNMRNIQDGSAKSFTCAFRESLLEGAMGILLNSLAILSDDSFHTVLSPHLTHHILVSLTSHGNLLIKNLSLKLLSAFLSRIRSPALTDFLTNQGFFLTSLYVQASSELSNLILNICKGYGPISFPLVLSLLHSPSVSSNLVDWIQEDAAGLVPALISMGLLPSLINSNKVNGPVNSRHVQSLLSTVTRFCTLNPKEELWKALFCPALESAPQTSNLIAKMFQESLEILRDEKKEIFKKSDFTSRVLWLLERGSVSSKFGLEYDKWLLNFYINEVINVENCDNEFWRYFVRKQRKRLYELFAIFLCRIFSPNKGDKKFLHEVLRFLLHPNVPPLSLWLPKVMRSDEKIERVFTAFVRVFLSNALERNGGTDGRMRSHSFQSVITSPDGNFLFRLSIPQEPDLMLDDTTSREKFEEILICAGMLSPSNGFSSSFTPNFGNAFKINLLESPTISGVSYQELRQCQSCLEKMKSNILTYGEKSKGEPIFQRKFFAAPHKMIITSNTSYFENVFDAVIKYSMDVLEVVTKVRTRQEIEIEQKISNSEENSKARRNWRKIFDQMSHPRAPWHFPSQYPRFSSLDQSEGPGRVRIRLRKEILNVHPRFILPQRQKEIEEQQRTPLDYLFNNAEEERADPVNQSDIQFMRFCTRVLPGEEFFGEVLFNSTTLHFIPEIRRSCEQIEVSRKSIFKILKRRYNLEDRAVEVFVDGQSFLFVFQRREDREEFMHTLIIPGPDGSRTQSDTSLAATTSRWLKGRMSNFDYLMFINTAAGRTYSDLMQYPVFPFVLSNYDSSKLDLNSPDSFRDLRRPMAIQDPSKEKHFTATYNYLKRECDSTPFHYGSHYSNSGIVLHFLVRLPPYTQQFLKYQDGSFDLPDRSFHSVETTWRLASKDSNTDFKEAIPEYYYLPEFFKNLQSFDLGIRQNGVRVNDVILPPWAKENPRLFTLINRQALESNEVRKYMADWIDLIFGFKQTGKPAIASMNVFHPSTYEGFEVEGVSDELVRRARKAMVSTYGQTPKQLFFYPHPKGSPNPGEKCDVEVLDTVCGLRWGSFVGSPASPDLIVISMREYKESVKLFETQSRIVFWPERTLILSDSVEGSWDPSGIRIRSNIVYLCLGDEITFCRGTDTSLWVGHQSGKISVLKLSPNWDRIVESIDLVGHYEPIRKICINQEFSIAISCSGENYVIIWDLNTFGYFNHIEVAARIDDLYSSRSTGEIALLTKEVNEVSLFTINGFLVGTIKPEEKVESVCISSLDPGRNVNVLALGCDYGLVRIYSTWDMKFLNEIKAFPLSILGVKSIRYSRDGRRLYCLGKSHEHSISMAFQLPSLFSLGNTRATSSASSN